MNQAKSTVANHILFFDLVRNATMLAVVIYHAVAAYSTITPYWPVHDGSAVIADAIRQVLDVFMMSIFFFVAGYFALPSLQRRGTWPFLRGKLRRLGLPWLFAILIIVPLLMYIPVVKKGGEWATSFWSHWLTYVTGFGRFYTGLMSPERPNQLHYWFLSLLISFFVVFTLLYAAKVKWQGIPPDLATPEPTSSRSILRALLLVGVLTSIGHFIVVLLVPYMSWVTIGLLLHFQLVNLVLYIGYFALGVYAHTKKWFVNSEPIGRLAVWVPVAILLTVGFLLVGKDVFANPGSSHELPWWHLLAFAFVRSFLCLSFLVMIVSYAAQHWNRSSPFNQKLAAHSLNIYLVANLFVMPFQDTLMIWSGGPAMVKAGIVTLAAVLIGYGISLLIVRFPGRFATVLFGLFVLAGMVT